MERNFSHTKERCIKPNFIQKGELILEVVIWKALSNLNGSLVFVGSYLYKGAAFPGASLMGAQNDNVALFKNNSFF